MPPSQTHTSHPPMDQEPSDYDSHNSFAHPGNGDGGDYGKAAGERSRGNHSVTGAAMREDCPPAAGERSPRCQWNLEGWEDAAATVTVSGGPGKCGGIHGCCDRQCVGPEAPSATGSHSRPGRQSQSGCHCQCVCWHCYQPASMIQDSQTGKLRATGAGSGTGAGKVRQLQVEAGTSKTLPACHHPARISDGTGTHRHRDCDSRQQQQQQRQHHIDTNSSSIACRSSTTTTASSRGLLPRGRHDGELTRESSLSTSGRHIRAGDAQCTSSGSDHEPRHHGGGDSGAGREPNGRRGNAPDGNGDDRGTGTGNGSGGHERDGGASSGGGGGDQEVRHDGGHDGHRGRHSGDEDDEDDRNNNGGGGGQLPRASAASEPIPEAPEVSAGRGDLPVPGSTMINSETIQCSRTSYEPSHHKDHVAHAECAEHTVLHVEPQYCTARMASHCPKPSSYPILCGTTLCPRHEGTCSWRGKHFTAHRPLP